MSNVEYTANPVYRWHILPSRSIIMYTMPHRDIFFYYRRHEPRELYTMPPRDIL
jgi:hypothetical protein